ncbi:MAG: flavodoxin-dependent (E)-4-hydroxy-3-methylbut-2-enyl-diphosphate synthase, partial [Selenomonadaceae bacterium]|nr:flavodoxin-dependent (E)-4-hydroxy-3-methylbut-2-enyl-diphosphate synthase [Selenomonadaceae bacterium]
METKRKMTRQIHIGPIAIGGGAPVSVQSMTNTKTADTESTVAQIRSLVAAGCDIVRLAVPDMEAAKNLGNIIREVSVPLVADIHFDYKLAIEAIHQGIAALRLNPGNIGGEEKVRAVVREAKAHSIPIRIGVNAGSLDKKLLEK